MDEHSLTHLNTGITPALADHNRVMECACLEWFQFQSHKISTQFGLSLVHKGYLETVPGSVGYYQLSKAGRKVLDEYQRSQR